MGDQGGEKAFLSSAEETKKLPNLPEKIKVFTLQGIAHYL
jgi:hypothetical protein